MQKGIIKVEGMATQHDADQVLHALYEVWGIWTAEVSLNNNEAVFSFDEKAASYQDFQQAIIDTGFEIYQKEDL